ncbi:TPA: autotransporter adhesin BigA [Salmonella enterica subsp. enterica serovar Oranienburg]|nr:autotransporter adhesin BigA [Salmonella enterica]
MQKKKLISIAIALTLQSYYIPAIAAENNDDEKECPSNISSLPKEKRAKLSPTCLATLPENDNHWGWVAGGVAALVAGVAIGVENNGGGDSTHSYTPPTPDDGGNVTPPDDGGDDDVTPPDDSGDDDVTPPDDSGDDDVTPPDDSGDDDVTPPDDSGDDDVTPPDDSGDDDVTPPDDSGDDDVTPPDDSGDDDVTPPDDSGDDDVTPPDDSGDDDVTPPDDSGDDDDTPTDNSVTTFSNGVTIDKGKDTLAFDSFKLDNGSVLEGAVWNYSEQDDQWQLTTEDGKTLNVTGWDVTDANAAVIEGTQENGLYWKYDSRGYLIIADDNTTVITGDGESHTSDRGMDISGQDRTGVIISGDRTVNTLTGDSSVTDGATGMVISGDGTTNTISGHSTVDNAIGALISGNNTTTDFSGDITVSGDSNTVAISGNMNISAAEYQQDSLIASDTPLTGIVISGNNNNITLDGGLNIDVNDQSSVSGQYLDVTSLNVMGAGNSVDIRGGIDITQSESEGLDDDSATITGINIDGNSEVTLSGQSTVDTTTIVGGNVILAKVDNGGSLILSDDSAIEINASYINSGYYTDNALLMANGEGASIANNSDITSNGVYSIMRADNGATISNSGDILVYATNSDGGDNRTSIVRAKAAGSTAHNEAGGDITVISNQKPAYESGMNEYPIRWYTHTFYAMMASGQGDVVNDKDATIHLQGAGMYGVAASKGTALNAGDIYLDSFVPTLDDENNITSTSYWHPSSLYLTSSGMVAGSTDGGIGDATATNTGTINVNNAGFGMMALNGGTAINQGTINLTADEGVTKTDDNQLVGMAALNGGTVINDTTGTINIDAAYGKPFLTDSSGLIINYGQVCFGDDCQNSEEYNPTNSDVSIPYTDGATIADAGTSTTLENNAVVTGNVSNAGEVSGKPITVLDSGTLTNNDSGVINSDTKVSGNLVNDGTISGKLTQNGGDIVNNGTIDSRSLTTGGVLTNGTDGTMTSGAKVTGTNSAIINDGTFQLGSATDTTNASMLEINDYAQFFNTGTLILDNNKNAIHLNPNNGTLYNTGTMDLTATSNKGAINYWGAGATFINDGTVNATTAALAYAAGGASSAPDQHAFFWNQSNGVINYDADNGRAVDFSTNSNYVAVNDGTMNISGNNAYGMYGGKNAQLVNNGTIELGTEGTTDTGMVAMALDSNATADAVIENNGTINIHADNSYAFSVAGAGHVVNNGTVVIDDNVTSSGLIKQGDSVNVEGTNGNNGNSDEVHYANYTLPDTPVEPESNAVSSATAGGSTNASNNLSGYVVGTSADGSAGKLKVSNASMNGVEINTGFAAGTADTTISFDNVVEGSNLSDAGAIQSTTVVWNAQGSQDSDGNVDVTMTKNAYADVATDASVSGVASALDAGYTNNELYTSLNVGTTAELNNALKQVSGAQATTVFREARILSNRFNMLADAAPQIKDGLAFNVVAKGDPRAELGNDTQYDMLALRQKLDLTTSQNLTLEYGIARLDGDGSKTAGDNGLTGGYSQFFGLKHSMAFEEGLAWNNSLRYDVHNLDSSRSVSYGDTNKVADSDVRQQYLEFRSEGAKTFTMMSDTLKVTPYAGVKFRHTMEDGYKERSAGDFNLSMNSGNETAVDSLVGLKLDYARKDGWSATATLEGGPNLSYSKSQRTASLQGATGQSFGIDDGQKGGGVNGLATIGVKYSSNDTALHLDAYQWKEDGISDKGFMLNVKKTFR